MFLIFKFLPDWFWILILLAGIFGFLLTYLPQAKPFKLLLKIISLGVVALGIFINGMLYSDNTWKAAAKELQAKVDVAEAESKVTNTKIETKVVYKTQVIREQAKVNIQFIDREVVKYDTTCIIPLEFINAHNRAAEPPK